MKYRNVWPIDEKGGKEPAGWKGWPYGKKFALVLTHDVDTSEGQSKCLELMKIDEDMGFRSSFNFVPLRYTVLPEVLSTLRQRGFEVGVHGLYHDGLYYLSKDTFLKRAARINSYLKEWGAVGYRAPSMYHKLDWFHELEIEYDASTFDTDPFEPHSVGVGTIFPFFVKDPVAPRGYVELPYTLPQDFSLFILMQKKNIEIWKQKLEWVAKRGGMALINTHPDYMNFCGSKSLEVYPVQLYEEFLKHVKDRYTGQYWHALPMDVARFWKNNY
ncbi:hypothetical protein [Geobacter sp. AOG1]|uniref:hypothetical protein n=1 Tax=Geobacter sp. AOG1 TaxID=1566346 RepID=UPI001CC4C3C4|nr:hypothetical protein [Geobacter sp. AOG1]